MSLHANIVIDCETRRAIVSLVIPDADNRMLRFQLSRSFGRTADANWSYERAGETER